MLNITIIGFGEAGRIYAQDLALQGASITVWDKKFLKPQAVDLQALAQSIGVQVAPDLTSALEGASLILSLVTASNALPLALEIAPQLRQGQTLLDFNSVAPETKRCAASAICAGNGEYLDVAVMAPVPPKRLGTPLLLGGKTATQVAQHLINFGCQATAASKQVGDVSAIKMCRSVMIKGLEALTTECLGAAQRYGVEDAVLTSLHASFPSLGWNTELPDYLISRVAEHGVRRAEEMQQVVKTLQDVGISGEMSQATVSIQGSLPAKLVELHVSYADLLPFNWQSVMRRLTK